MRGCTHITELLGYLPTAAVQTFAGLRAREDQGPGKPFQLDRCHALETTGEAVRRYYPKWYRGDGKADGEADALKRSPRRRGPSASSLKSLDRLRGNAIGLDSRLRGNDELKSLDSRLRGNDELKSLDSRLRGNDESKSLDSASAGMTVGWIPAFAE